jgi:2,3-bisphosphoglycerate-independent phosphoglycerate mutase
MKYALIIPDGAADEPQNSLAGQTPLQAARTPQMDAIAYAGVVGRADNVPASMTPGSDVGTMSLFGYDPLKYHTGRAPLEAAAQAIELAAGDWAVRCNLVTVEDGVMKSFTAGQIPSDLASQLIQLLQNDGGGGECWEFHTGVSYRNLLIYRGCGQPAPFGPQTKTFPPHDITDKPIAGFLPQGPGAAQLRQLMDRSIELFALSEENQARRGRGEKPATQIWLWGEGSPPALTPFAERFGRAAAVITAVDLLRGIGRLLGWQIVDVPGATGYLDTDYAAKGRFAIETLHDFDLVVVHVEATDEASHEGDATAKVEALERIDRDVVGPVHMFLKEQGDYRILVSPDHPTFLRTKTHSHGYVPFAMCGRGIEPDVAKTYDETTATASTLVIDRGCELMPLFLLSSEVPDRQQGS